MVLGETFVLWFVPAAAVVGILFALIQWFIVSRVSVGSEGKGNNGYVHVEEDGISDLEVVAKCAEIQAAISEGLCVCAAIEISSTHSLPSIGFLVESLLSCLRGNVCSFSFGMRFFQEKSIMMMMMKGCDRGSAFVVCFFFSSVYTRRCFWLPASKVWQRFLINFES